METLSEFLFGPGVQVVITGEKVLLFNQESVWKPRANTNPCISEINRFCKKKTLSE